MSQNNQSEENGAMFLIVGLIGAGFVFFAAIAYALLVFCSLVLTALFIIASFRSYQIGSITVDWEEGEPFIRRGLIGAFLLPAFVMFCEEFFGVDINNAYSGHLIFGGYALGSLGIAILEAKANAESAEQAPMLPPAPPSMQIAPPRDVTPQAPQPFRFASWDDEDELRKRDNGADRR